jgi:hypothetical protein
MARGFRTPLSSPFDRVRANVADIEHFRVLPLVATPSIHNPDLLCILFGHLPTKRRGTPRPQFCLPTYAASPYRGSDLFPLLSIKGMEVLMGLRYYRWPNQAPKGAASSAPTIGMAE